MLWVWGVFGVSWHCKNRIRFMDWGLEHLFYFMRRYPEVMAHAKIRCRIEFLDLRDRLVYQHTNKSINLVIW